MNEIKMREFDYTIVDPDTADYLENKTLKINGIAESMRTHIGKELKEVQDKLASNYQGVFAKWYESLGLKKHTVYYWINVYEFSRNLEDTKQLENFAKAPKSLQVETMKNNKPEELKERVLDGDITTHKEFKVLEKQLKEKEKEIETLKNAKPEVIEKEVIKEVKITPHDYDGLKSDNKQLSQALKQAQAELDATNKRNKFIEDQHKNSLEDRKDDLQRKEKLEKMEKELSRLANRREKLSDQIDTIKELTSLKFEVDKILEKIAPYYFNHNINAIRQDPTLEQSFVEIVDALQKWCDEMYNLLGRQNTIEGEIIND